MGKTSSVWIFDDPGVISDVLARSEDFRVPTRAEFVPNVSRSFFLSAEILGWNRGKELKEILTQYFGLEGMSKIRPRILDAIMNAKAQSEDSEFVGLACRQAICTVLGISESEALTLIALLRIAENHTGTDVADASLQLLREKIDLLITHSKLDPDGFIALIRDNESLSAIERALLIIPFFEMLSLGQHEVLARAALLAPQGTATEKVQYATTKVDGIVLTRVAVRPQNILGQNVMIGDRVLLDVTSANKHKPTPNLCFGTGEHCCVGRLLAIEIATLVVEHINHVP